MSALRKVLVVDDDPVVRKSYGRVLSGSKGYAVITAENADQALQRLQEQEYDLVVTDIRMPGMDGVALAERVRAQRPWLPVVIITGYGSSNSEQRARAAGVAAFVHKPLTPESIESSTSYAMAQPVTPISVPAATQTNASYFIDDTASPTQQPNAAQHAPLRHFAGWAAAPFIGLVFAVVGPPAALLALLAVGARAFWGSELRRKLPRMVRNLVLFLAAPLIGLVYALALPMVGMGALAWTAWQRAEASSPRAARILHNVRDVALLLAAPFIGLAYAVLLPFVGMIALLWTAAQAVSAGRTSAQRA
jgi:CheY-like chemotaxis protein